MAVNFRTTNPSDLLHRFDTAINQTEWKGKITTWEKNPQGFYTHKAANWRHKAFFKPTITAGVLTFSLVRPKSVVVTVATYGYYHGHLIETFLNHFDRLFTSADATALPAAGDSLAA